MTTKPTSIGDHEARLDAHGIAIGNVNMAIGNLINRIQALERIVVDQARSIAALEHNALCQPNDLTATGLMMATENAERMVKGRLARGEPADGDWLGPTCGPPIMRPVNRIREQVKRLRDLAGPDALLQARATSAKQLGATAAASEFRAVICVLNNVADEIEAALSAAEGSKCR